MASKDLIAVGGIFSGANSPYHYNFDDRAPDADGTFPSQVTTVL